MNIPNTIASFFASDFFHLSLWITQLTAYLLLIYLIVSAFYYMKKSKYLDFRYLIDFSEVTKGTSVIEKKSEKQWVTIKKKIDLASESEWKSAITDAEDLLDEIMRRAGFPGETFGEKIEQTTIDQLKTLDEAKLAHEIRNNIAHNPDYVLSQDQAKKVLDIYEKSLKELGYM